MSSTPLKKALDACHWKWPTGWKAVHLPGDTREDFALEMELAEMMSEAEDRSLDRMIAATKKWGKAKPAKPAKE